MKKSLLILLSTIMFNSCYAYTIGETYISSPSDIKMNQSDDYNYYNNVMVNKYKTKDNMIISTNSNHIITGINYNGKDQENLKISLGKYYQSYEILSKNKNLNNISNKDFSVSMYYVGNGMSKTEIILKNC